MPTLDRPLSGQLVVVTRAPHQSQAFIQLLESLGASVAHFPVIAIAPPVDWRPADQALRTIENYDWLIFTSANAVDAFFDRASAQNLQNLFARIAVVGPATAQALQKRHRSADLMADNHVAEGLIAAFARMEVNRLHMLLPRAAAARDVLPDALRERGADVDVVEVYRNTLPSIRENAAIRPSATWWSAIKSAVRWRFSRAWAVAGPTTAMRANRFWRCRALARSKKASTALAEVKISQS